MPHIKTFTKKILAFRDARDWKQFHSPKNLAISLALEASEVLEHFQWSKDNQLPSDKKAALADELADVYCYLLLLGHETGIDINRALLAKMKKNARNYPVRKARGKSLKYTEYLRRKKPASK